MGREEAQCEACNSFLKLEADTYMKQAWNMQSAYVATGFLALVWAQVAYLMTSGCTVKMIMQASCFFGK